MVGGGHTGVRVDIKSKRKVLVRAGPLVAVEVMVTMTGHRVGAEVRVDGNGSS